MFALYRRLRYGSWASVLLAGRVVKDYGRIPFGRDRYYTDSIRIFLVATKNSEFTIGILIDRKSPVSYHAIPYSIAVSEALNIAQALDPISDGSLAQVPRQRAAESHNSPINAEVKFRGLILEMQKAGTPEESASSFFGSGPKMMLNPLRIVLGRDELREFARLLRKIDADITKSGSVTHFT